MNGLHPTHRMQAIRTLPEITVTADGAPLPPELALTLAEVRVQQGLSVPALCELTFADPPGLQPLSNTLAPGAALEVRVTGHDAALFQGDVTAVEHVYQPTRGREVRVRAYDVLHRLRQRQRVRAHVEVTAQELAADLAADLGLAVEVAEPGPLWERLIQHRQSDLALLVDVAERCGLYLALRGATLHLLTLRGTGETLVLTLGESLLEARIEVNGDQSCRSVGVAGWDPLRAEAHQGRAATARVGLAVTASAPPVRMGGSGERHLTDEAVPDDGHATALAQAELDRRAAGEVTLWGVADGDTRLQPGARVEVAGVASTLAGRYVLTTVTHTIDARTGFISELSTVPPAPHARARGAITAPGVVTQIDDPEHLGRVQVALPSYGDVETGWMGVLSPGAGAAKGLVALPDVGDQVLVLFAHEDPARGVVVGGLYGVQGPPDGGIEDGAVRRYTLVTPGGQRIQLDDAACLIRLENSDGSFVELAPERVRIHAATDLEIEAPGRSLVIRAAQIDFERA